MATQSTESTDPLTTHFFCVTFPTPLDGDWLDDGTCMVNK